MIDQGFHRYFEYPTSDEHGHESKAGHSPSTLTAPTLFVGNSVSKTTMRTIDPNICCS